MRDNKKSREGRLGLAPLEVNVGYILLVLVALLKYFGPDNTVG